MFSRPYGPAAASPDVRSRWLIRAAAWRSRHQIYEVGGSFDLVDVGSVTRSTKLGVHVHEKR